MKNILVLTFWSYKDALIQTYTLPYLRIISRFLPQNSTIFLLTLEKPHLQINTEERKNIEHELSKYGIQLIEAPYQNFGIKALFTWIGIIFSLFFLIFRKNIHYIHSFCTPAGVAGVLLSYLTFRPLILDSYEPHAEASIENGDWTKQSFRFKFLFFMEKLMSKRAKYIISATEGMKDYALKKYNATFKNFFIKPACVNLELFSEQNIKKYNLLEKYNLKNKIVCVYAGKFGGIYLEQEIFDFLKLAADFWKDRFVILLLTNQSDEQIEAWANAANLDKSLIIKEFVFHHQIPDYMGLADFALTPVKPIPTKRYCTPIKNGEYWALGLPIVSTANISDDSDIIEKYKIGSIIKKFNTKNYQQVIEEIDQILQVDRKELFQKIRQVAYQYRSFEIAEKIYEKIYAK